MTSVGRAWGCPSCSKGPGAVAVYKGVCVGVSVGGLEVFLHGGGLAAVLEAEEAGQQDIKK